MLPPCIATPARESPKIGRPPTAEWGTPSPAWVSPAAGLTSGPCGQLALDLPCSAAAKSSAASGLEPDSLPPPLLTPSQWLLVKACASPTCLKPPLPLELLPCPCYPTLPMPPSPPPGPCNPPPKTGTLHSAPCTLQAPGSCTATSTTTCLVAWASLSTWAWTACRPRRPGSTPAVVGSATQVSQTRAERAMCGCPITVCQGDKGQPHRLLVPAAIS